MHFPQLHCLGVPHTITSKEYVPCAFTQKVYKFLPMMTKLGYPTIHYGNEASEVFCSEHVTVTTIDDFKKTYGDDYATYWKTQEFDFSADSHLYQTFYKNAAAEVRKRAKKDDMILCFWGTGHRQVADQLSDLPVHIVEPGVGYPACFAPHRVYESGPKLQFVAGTENERYSIYNDYKDRVPEIANWDTDRLNPHTTPRWTDAVIPNYFDPDDFEFRVEKEDYIFFIGRIMWTKGLEIAMRLAHHFDIKLYVAGQGDFVENMGFEPYPQVEIIGTVDVEQRKELMAGAKVGIVATLYHEPFGGTHAEFLFSGTPVLTTDWGVFRETVAHEKWGFRGRAFEHFVWAFENLDKIDPHDCRDFAMRNFSMDRVSLMYHEYFQDLLRAVNADNFWYENPERTQLDRFRTDMTWDEIQTRIAELEPKTRIGQQYNPGGSVQGGDSWLYEQKVWDYCIGPLHAKSILDIGAGEGHAAKYFSEMGCHVVAVDNDEHAINNAVYPIVRHNFKEGAFPGGTIDLVYMSEFVEHLPQNYLPHLAETLTRTDMVLMTFARPGQQGLGHINNQSEQYWVSWFARYGFVKDEPRTQEIRELAEHIRFGKSSILFRR